LHFFRNSDRLADTFHCQNIPILPGWYLPLGENRFLQAGKGAENTKEKSRQCFTPLKPTSKHGATQNPLSQDL